MTRAQPALFRRYPGLVGRLPHRPLLPGPTPAEAVALDGLREPLFVKRDDLSCPLYAGNKPRKLEFLLGGALERGARRLVTTGGLGTNHGLATTILGREAGLATTLVLVDQPVTRKVRESLLLFLAYGARLIYAGTVAGAVVGMLRALGGPALRGERPVRIPTGGSSSLGNLGFVSAGLELGDQVKAGELPEPEALFVAVGTGGSLVGLTLGLRLAGLATRAVGVVVSDILPPGPGRLARAARRTLRRLRRADASIPDLEIRPSAFELCHDQLGPGYGAPTPEAEEAVRWAAAAGLRLDLTYTGKCLAEIRSRAQRGGLGRGPVLFWHTYNGVDVAARAPRRARVEELPRRIQQLLGQAEASGWAAETFGSAQP